MMHDQWGKPPFNKAAISLEVHHFFLAVFCSLQV